MAQEAETQKAVLQYLSYKKLFHWRQNSGAMPIVDGMYRRRFVSFGTAGAPDIFIVKDGSIYGLEIKSPTGRQNDNQKTFQEGFEKAGGRYYLVRSLDDVIKVGL